MHYDDYYDYYDYHEHYDHAVMQHHAAFKLLACTERH